MQGPSRASPRGRPTWSCVRRPDVPTTCGTGCPPSLRGCSALGRYSSTGGLSPGQGGRGAGQPPKLPPVSPPATASVTVTMVTEEMCSGGCLEWSATHRPFHFVSFFPFDGPSPFTESATLPRENEGRRDSRDILCNAPVLRMSLRMCVYTDNGASPGRKKLKDRLAFPRFFTGPSVPPAGHTQRTRTVPLTFPSKDHSHAEGRPGRQRGLTDTR